jgi:DNA-binding NarL/FixJ family response regulator
MAYTPQFSAQLPSTLPLKVLLVDDSEDFLSSAQGFLADESWLEIAGCSLTGRDAIQQVDKLHPDLVLMDMRMPEMNGIEATRHIKAQPNAPRVIIITLHDDQDYGAMAREARADGFVSKMDFGDRLIPAIRQMFALSN